MSQRYGSSEKGNFFVSDTIGVPHPYMIGPGHVAEAADYFSGRLGKDAIESAESKRIFCYNCRGQLKYSQHETALLVSCKAELKVGDEANPELHAYLLAIKDKAEEDKFVGFAFLDAR